MDVVGFTTEFVNLQDQDQDLEVLRTRFKIRVGQSVRERVGHDLSLSEWIL